MLGEPVVEMDGVVVKYGDRVILGGGRQILSGQRPQTHDKEGLFWTVRRGERWGVFGPNGEIMM